MHKVSFVGIGYVGLCTAVCFANVCEKIRGADIRKIAEAIGKDHRINPLNPADTNLTTHIWLKIDGPKIIAHA